MPTDSATPGNEPDEASRACLERSRSAVLNVLVAIGAMIAVSGLVLRNRVPEAPPAGIEPARLRTGLLFALAGCFVLSTLLRRSLGGRARLREPSTRGTRFFWSRVIPAVVGALTVPLGLAQGWWISPDPREILPYWLAALVLGILALPRAVELEDFELPMGGRGGIGS